MTLLNELYTIWFQNPSWWFNTSPNIDLLLESKFYIWIDSININTLSYEKLSNNELIGLIILFDQIPRHAYRNSYGTHVIQYYLQYALKIISYIQNNTIYNQLNVYEWSFTNLPLRHTQNTHYIHKVMKDSWIKITTLKDDVAKLHIHKFIRATYERCPMKQLDFIKEYNKLWLNEKWSNETYKILLSYAPENEAYFDFKNVATNKLYNDCKNICKNKKAIIISLSGGIDSMICSYIFTKLNEVLNFKLQLCAVHINYCNRIECEQEEKLLIDWCSYLHIPLYIRKITEIQRKPAMDHNLREVYETYTRNIRYATYKEVWNSFLLQDGLPNVILGHNHDDCIENILTNITHQCKYDNLMGMSTECIQDDITFIRPLLQITKKDIYAFSREFNIPHLQNSTPSWSMRGQIRDSVRPTLENWNKSSIYGLIELSHNVSDLYSIMTSYIDNIFEQCKINTQTENTYGSWETKKYNIQTAILFWRAFLYKLTGYIPSVKSLKALEVQLERFKLTDSTKLSFKIHTNIQLYIIQKDVKIKDLYKIIIMKQAITKK